MPMHEKNAAYTRGWKTGFSRRRSMNAGAPELRLARPKRDRFGQLVRESRYGGKGYPGLAWR
ncbi:MAG: hypothetical protein ACM3US_08365 [Sphingomonadaceae bacterium]